MENYLSSNMEDYLEAIGVLEDKNGVVRVKDIGKFLNVANPSVTSALNTLSQKGFVIHERYGYVKLTRQGEKKSREVQKKHNILVKFLSDILNIDAKTAVEDACKMEHALSPQTFRKLTKFIEFVETSPDSQRPDWLKGLDHYFKTGKHIKCKLKKLLKEN
jgi:DtxR family transcriptional regulator, Mn-dependent transcriptional regulator